MPKRNLILYTLVLVFTYGQVATDLYLPSLLNISYSLHTNTNMVQLSITSYIASMMLSQPLYGIASDGFGRKPVLLTGTIITMIGTLVCIFSTNIYHLILGRFIQGLGAGAGTTVCRAVIRDLYKGHDLIKFSSYLAVYGMVFMIIAPIIGGYIEHHLNWQTNFQLLYLIAIINLINLCLILPETNINKIVDNMKLKNVLSNFNLLLTSRNFTKYTLCSTIANANVYIWITAGSILLQKNYGLSPVSFGWCYFISGIFYILGNLFNKKYIYLFGPINLITTGFVIQVIASILLFSLYILNIQNIMYMTTILSIMMFGISLVFPNANGLALNDFSKISGTASALFSIIQTSGAVFASAFIALSNNQSIITVSLCFIFLSSLGLYFNLKRNLLCEKLIAEYTT